MYSNNSSDRKNGSGGGNSAESEGKISNKLPKYASKILKEWFCTHLDDPYPSKEEKIMLASKTNLNIRQVPKY